MSFLLRALVDHKKFIVIGALGGLYFLARRFFNSPYTLLNKRLDRKIIIVTGASDGLGKYTARELLKQGANVIYATRNEKKTKNIFEEMNTDEQSRARFIELDLSDFNSIQKFIDTFNKQYDKLDILINNAGMFSFDYKKTTDGIEQCLQVNTLGPMLLTEGLLDKLHQANGRIINVSSRAYKRLDLKAFSEMLSKKPEDISHIGSKYSGMRQYSLTKYGNIAFTIYLNSYLQKTGLNVKVVALHPGVILTELFKVEGKLLLVLAKAALYPILSIFCKSLQAGVQTTLHLCYLEDKDIESGGYYTDCQPRTLLPFATKSENVEGFMKMSKALIDHYGKGQNKLQIY